MKKNIKRQALLRIKEDLQKEFGSQIVANVDEMFIISETQFCANDFVRKVYEMHMRESSSIYFSVLALNPGICICSNKDRARVDALEESFGGSVTRTENRHIAEWLWQGKHLHETEAYVALFNVV